MWRIVAIFLALTPVISWAASICPAQISLSEKAKAVPPGFTIFYKDPDGPRFLIGMNFFVGRLDNSGLLIPQRLSNFKTGWKFPPIRPIWIICNYQDSGLTLAYKLPSKVSSCTVTLSDPRNGALTGQRLVSSTKCW